MNHKRASELAERIVRNWAARGYDVRAWVEKEPYHYKAQSTGYTVRTNLVNGLPSDFRPSLIADLAARPFINF